MGDINNLKEIGLNEIARKTHIEAEYLGYIFNKEYAKLARFNTKGFIKILEREYGVNLSEWLNEYEAFIREHKEEVAHKTITISPKIPAYTAADKGSSGLFLTIVILAIIAGLVWFFDGYKYISGISNLFADKNRSVSYSNSLTIQKAEQNVNTIKESNITLNLPTPQITQANSEQSLNLSPTSTNESVKPTETNSSKIVATPKQDINQTTINPPIATKESNQTATINLDKNASNSRVEYKTAGLAEIKITPRKKVWLGVINLEDGKKRSLNIEKTFVVNLDKNQLVVTGHGEINLEIGDEIIKFNTDNTRRFLVEKGKVTLIDVEEFKALNKGKTW